VSSLTTDTDTVNLLTFTAVNSTYANPKPGYDNAR